MKTIKVNYKNQPILDISRNGFGLNRERVPDAKWCQLRNTNINSDTVTEVELKGEIKTILLEDLAYAYGQDTKKFSEKLKEFGFNFSIEEENSKRKEALKWFYSLSAEQQFYKTISANSIIKGDRTRHPDSLTSSEIQKIYKYHGNK